MGECHDICSAKDPRDRAGNPREDKCKSGKYCSDPYIQKMSPSGTSSGKSGTSLGKSNDKTGTSLGKSNGKQNTVVSHP